MAIVTGTVKTVATRSRGTLAIVMSDDDDLAISRWQLFLQQWDEDHDGAGQSELARRLDVDASTINKSRGDAPTRGSRPHRNILLAIAKLPIDSEFFTNARLVEPHYKAFMRDRAAARSSKVVSLTNNPHWKRFERFYLPQLKLTEEETEWLRSAPFRGGVQDVDDYVKAAEALLHEALVEPT